MRVLDAAMRTVDNSLREGVLPGQSFRVLLRGNVSVDCESDSEVANRTRWVLAIGPQKGKSVAWIGGGFCIGPQLLLYGGAKQTVFEIEPSLREFCPEGVEFVPGDWRDTISGRFDVICYDLGGDVPRETLLKHLKPGGVILPKED
jgi:hypothetical protein